MNRRFLIAALLWLLPIAAQAQTVVNTELPPANVPSDTDPNTTAGPAVNARLMGYDASAVWKRVTFGQQTMVNSLPVTIASNQTAVPGNLTQIGGATQSATNPLFVRLTDGSAALAPGTEVTHDTALGTITLVKGGATFARASAAVPSDVSADGDGVLFWALRSGALAINPTFGGVLATTGNGVVGTGVQRIALASDSLLPNRCANDALVTSVPISTATSGNVQLVAISGSTIVYVCGFDVTSAGTVNFQFVSGTGTACATGETDRTGTYQAVAQWGIVRANAGAVQFKGAAGEALCIELSGSVQVDGLLTYVQN